MAKTEKNIWDTFRMKILRTYVSVFYENSQDLIRRLGDEINRRFNWQNYSSEVAINTLMETAMGVSREKVQHIGFNYAMAVKKIDEIVHRRHFNPRGGVFNQEHRRRHEHNHYTRDDLDDIDDNDVGEKKRFPLLEMLMDGKKKGEMTDKEVLDDVNIALFAGYNTVSTTASFVLCTLGYLSKIKARVHEELDSIFYDSERQCTFQDAIEMKYLKRVILETLRLLPAIPLFGRVLNKDVRIVTGNYVLPKDATIATLPFMAYRAEKYYPNPLVFNPDNFLPDNTQQRNPYAYIPFSAGPRSCLGRKFAMSKMKILLSTILKNNHIAVELTLSTHNRR
ncbi:PREDICTED: cytochrome P450 4g15-like [Dinoponera quadriceps]|uniref:Cytochrome P450 4g15-like n=1 Tax=Dinoponera quadriceps TaxID=609295 RepID=A0A6P3Y2W2_DINQU|nr:PREDICTED: cytochrome P450 4g15-like [Dinoponera quadriceps]